jgi:LysR family nitrogen assimilation transcriptional regulator
MELRTLRAFVKVAEIGNISQAAALLGLTQPSLSRIIASLESEFGGPLFYRTGRGVTLTEIGEAALPRARNIVINSEQLSADIRDLLKAPSGVVSVALLPSLMRDLAGDLFTEVRRLYPEVRLRMLEGFSSQIEEWLGDGRADIALLSRYRNVLASSEELLSESHLMLVGTAGTQPRGDTVEFSQLAELPLVLPAAPNGLRLAVDDAARRLRVNIRVIFEADSLQAQKEIIARERCFAVLSPQTVGKEVAQGLLEARRIVNPELPRLVVMSTTTQRPLSRAAREVSRIVRALMGEAGAVAARTSSGPDVS